MKFDFDNVPDRRHTNAVKWDHYAEDVLPLWVADTDFAVDPQIVAAMRERLEHPVFGYSVDNEELKKVICQRELERYGWRIQPEDLIFVPGIVSGFNFAIRAFCANGDSVIYQTPAYPPFIDAPGNFSLEGIQNDLEWSDETGRYEINFEKFEAQLKANTSLFILCNPQNPTGRVFSEEELTRMGEICLKHGVKICSDEIHSEIVYSESQHIPVASLNESFAQNCVTFIAPSKTFNIPGLSCSVAIIQNPEMRAAFESALKGLCCGVIDLSQRAALAAYRDCSEWLKACTAYLQANRDFAVDFIHEAMPQIRVGKPQGTFLLWLDCAACGIPGSPAKFFEEKGRVGLNDGSAFGGLYANFVRLNIGTSRSRLELALRRMADALKK